MLECSGNMRDAARGFFESRHVYKFSAGGLGPREGGPLPLHRERKMPEVLDDARAQP